MNTSIEFLEWLTQCIKRAKIDIAPDYSNFTCLTYAIANDCGEQGRSYFHEITSLSAKYDAKKNDKQYDYSLRSGRNGNSLGTVYHLAKAAGVDLSGEGWKPEWNHYRSSDHLTPPLSPFTRVRETNFPNYPNIYGNKFRMNGKELSERDLEEREEEEQREEANGLALPPAFEPYEWPRFLQRCIDCGEMDSQKMALLLTSLAILGATSSPLLRFLYSHKTFHPNLLLFVVAPSAAGKGVISWVQKLGEPLQKRYRRAYAQAIESYNKEMAIYNNKGKKKDEMEPPVKPPMKLFYISGNNTGTGILENLMDSDGVGCIFTQEADELSTAIAADYGHFSDILRKVHDHEGLSFNRRTNHEYREIDATYVTLVMSGTPGQVEPMILSRENGLFSRFVFYYMSPNHVWDSRFSEDETDYGELFRQWGERWHAVMEAIRKTTSSITFSLTKAQQVAFDERLASIFKHADFAHGGTGRSTVARIGINLIRLMTMVAWTRALDEWLTSDEKISEEISDNTRRLLACPGITADKSVLTENLKDGIVTRFRLSINEADYEQCLSMADKLYRHASYIMAMLPGERTNARVLTPRQRFLNDLPLEFSRQEALVLAERCGIKPNTMDKILSRMVESGQLIRIDKGGYRFNPDYKK